MGAEHPSNGSEHPRNPCREVGPACWVGSEHPPKPCREAELVPRKVPLRGKGWAHQRAESLCCQGSHPCYPRCGQAPARGPLSHQQQGIHCQNQYHLGSPGWRAPQCCFGGQAQTRVCKAWLGCLKRLALWHAPPHSGPCLLSCFHTESTCSFLTLMRISLSGISLGETCRGGCLSPPKRGAGVRIVYDLGTVSPLNSFFNRVWDQMESSMKLGGKVCL